MLKTLGIIGAALATATVAMPAQAQYYGGGYYGRGYDSGRDYYGDRYYNDRYANRYYRDRAYADRYYRGNRAYYGRDGIYRCRSNGTAGTVLGAIVGGLLGDAAVGRRGDGTAGAIAGAGVGALAGRAIERSNNRC
jgi:hypothetical protein